MHVWLFTYVFLLIIIDVDVKVEGKKDIEKWSNAELKNCIVLPP